VERTGLDKTVTGPCSYGVDTMVEIKIHKVTGTCVDVASINYTTCLVCTEAAYCFIYETARLRFIECL